MALFFLFIDGLVELHLAFHYEGVDCFRVLYAGVLNEYLT